MEVVSILTNPLYLTGILVGLFIGWWWWKKGK